MNTQFETMSGPELVAAFNAMAAKLPGGQAPVVKFADKQTGVKRCQKLAEQLDRLTPKADAKPAKKPVKKPATKKAKKARDDLTIVAQSEPPKPGSLGRQHWDQAVGKTVGAYLGQFEGEARRTKLLTSEHSPRQFKLEVIGRDVETKTADTVVLSIMTMLCTPGADGGGPT
jgi:hypothetical protein